MLLSELKSILQSQPSMAIYLENGQEVPSHFHLTELGKTTKHFIDCGGTERINHYANFQLWAASDVDHRLSSQKLLSIIDKVENKLQLTDLPVQVEYQGQTIGLYDLEFNSDKFILKSTKTDCLAKDICGIPLDTVLVEVASSCCTPGGGCC